jgi:hypothetical protein
MMVFGGADDSVKMNDLTVLDFTACKELEKAYRQLQQLAGNRLDELKWGELEELELLHLNGLKAITEAKKKLFLDQQQQQSAGCSDRGTEDSPPGAPSPGDNGLSGDKRKRLQFTTVVVRSMNRDTGEGVPREGAALGLGWSVINQETKPVDVFEEERASKRKARYKLQGPVPEKQREAMLLRAGVPPADLERERRTLDLIHMSRAQNGVLDSPPPTPASTPTSELRDPPSPASAFHGNNVLAAKDTQMVQSLPNLRSPPVVLRSQGAQPALLPRVGVTAERLLEVIQARSNGLRAERQQL